MVKPQSVQYVTNHQCVSVAGVRPESSDQAFLENFVLTQF